MGNAPDYDRSEWLNEKFSWAWTSPMKLPDLIDGAHEITQSNAILRYIARKHNLCGEAEEEKICVDTLENQITYTSNQLEKLKPEYLEVLPETMKLFSQFLGKRPWFAGDKLTYVDFLASDILDLHRIFEPKCLDGFPNLKDFITHLEAIPDSLNHLELTGHSLYGKMLHKHTFVSYHLVGCSRTGDEGLKEISAYVKTSRFLPSPIYTKIALWGNK